MVPLKLKPAFKDYLWGGEKLKTNYHMDTNLSPVAEAWVLSCHSDGLSTILNGECEGKTLSEFLETAGKSALGTNCDRFENFPILIKLIDALDNLSIQVHPDNEYALRVEGEYGKTEMWYVVDCEPGAFLYYGFQKEITKEEFRARIENNTLLEVLGKVTVKKGDCFFIEAGTLHAIGKGLLIAEIQQNSNTTYRVYDYGRTGADGKPRALHIDKAVEVTDTFPPKKQQLETLNGHFKTLAKCEYFSTSLLNVADSETIVADEKSFVSMLIIEGTGTVETSDTTLTYTAGDCFFIPANSGKVTIKGNAEIIITTV